MNMENRPKFDVEYIPCPKAGQTHYGCGICDKHTSSPSQKEETVDTFVRDITSMEYMPKSEARRRLDALLERARQEGRDEAVNELQPWLLGLDSVPWEDEVNEKCDAARSPQDKV